MIEVRHIGRAPEHASRGTLCWGHWDGRLAIVDHYPERFDPATMERAYVVRFAVDLSTREPIALSARGVARTTGVDVHVRDPRARYEDTTFSIGSAAYDPLGFVQGSFSAPIDFRVKVAHADLSPAEHAAAIRWFRERGMREIETKKSAKAIGAMLARTFMDLQADHYEIANEADRILRAVSGGACLSDAGSDLAWEALARGGVYVTARNGAVKWYRLPRE